MITIAKRYEFSAAHRLPGLPDGHPCKRLHGHGYEAEIQLHGVPGETGFVVDYHKIDDVWTAAIKPVLDHYYINEISGLETPSTEVLAIWIFDRLLSSRIGPLLSAVLVRESRSTWAKLTAEDYRRHRAAPEVEALMGGRR